MKTENKEILAGILLVGILGSVLSFVHSRAAIEKDSADFVLYAPFNKSDGLMNGADVRIAGLKTGRVVDQTLNEHYQVVVKIAFEKPVSLSSDSSVVIETDGLLGSKYIEIVPGADEEILENGSELTYTQDALVLTELMDKVNAYMRDKKQVDEDGNPIQENTPNTSQENATQENDKAINADDTTTTTDVTAKEI